MTTLESIRRKRDERVDNEGTPPAVFINAGDIAVDTDGGGLVLDFTEDSSTKKLYPFGIININNGSSTDLNVYVNQNRAWQKICRKGVILNISDFPGIRSVRISKRDATVTVAAGEVEVNVERAPLTDDEFRRRQVKTSIFMKAAKLFIGG